MDWKGGRITYNEWHIDLSLPPEQQPQHLSEDLLQVVYPKGLLLDLGWYPEGDPAGQFVLCVIQNGRWDTPLLQAACRSEAALRAELQRAVGFIREAAGACR